ncbi:MAG: MMPL family transporter [Alphaproteobacteria bacterium]|nr:MMPL family transporter [Alphaproteobacteria bacterium]
MGAASISGLVALACRRARLVVVTVLIAAMAAAAYVATHFSVHTEIAALIPADTPWRVHEAALEKAFVTQSDDIAVVIDGKTPELAEAAAARLSSKLQARRDLFVSVERVTAGPFFDREGLLYASEDEVRETTAALIRAQPLLAPVAADPSLRGVMTSLSTAAQGVAGGEASAADLKTPLGAIADAVDGVEAGRPVWFSWRALIAGHALDPDDSRQIIEIIPRADDHGSDPGAAAMAMIRSQAAQLHLDPADGVTMRLTGEIPMEVEELATLSEATGPIAIGTLMVVLVILWFAVRSPRIVGAILATVLAGLAITAAFGLAAYGRFNLISVAFMPLFVGLGVDFAIQFCVRYRAEALAEPDVRKALAKAGAGAGRGLTLAAAATGLGFLAFLPTRYKGVSELGLIAGVGMGVAFVLALTFLPALITWIGARSAAEEVGLPALRNADGPLQARRRAIVAAAAILGLLSLGLFPSLQFNFDPLRLRNPKTESVSTFLQLSADPDTNPNTLDVLMPNEAAAQALADKLSRLPQVQQAITLQTLIPPDQAAKLAIIQDADLLLDPTVNPFDVATPPSDAEVVQSLRDTAQALTSAAASPAGAPVRADALRLAKGLQAAAAGPPALRERLQATLIGGLPVALGQVRAMLTAEPITEASLPAQLKSDWVAADGQARIQVLPSGDPNNPRVIHRFVQAVRAVAPDATGTPLDIADTRSLILGAFGQAALLSIAAIVALLVVALRSPKAVALTLVPIVLTAILTVASCVLLGQDINLENLIALPLLLGIGVSFNIYFVVAWFAGERALLRSSLTRAILYSALTTGASFGALSLSQHPGTASMGILLLISLFWTLVATLIVQPAVLGLATDATAEPVSASSP